ncbi:rRNA pseudouridine synthase [Candidatus Dependentiae bacterium]|nr:rRNA pseudouridine synthase [Candidatus Dependentiae bacterium]
MKATAESSGASKNILVKYVAHSGLCSRRKAEALIKNGEISVNNFVVTSPGYELQPKDVVRYDKKILQQEKEFFYLIINKPAGMLCTASDPEGRPTIFDLLSHSRFKGLRLYNVGRLDRNTTGALIITNDGDLAQRMTHPSFEVRKTYAVTLHKPLSEEKVEQIKRGVQLEDGFVRVDNIELVRGRSSSQSVFVTLHSGKNRIIRRIFEQMGYYVEHLERISFGPISKKGLAKGEFRLLNQKEIAALLNTTLHKK